MQETNTTKSATLWQQLQQAANKYETTAFYEKDPSQFLLHYTDQKDIELASFFAAMMSFGRRDQFIPKIKAVLDYADKTGSFYQWILCGTYKTDIQSLYEKSGLLSMKGKYYRLYSFLDLLEFFDKCQEIISGKDGNEVTFGEFFRQKYVSSGANQDLADLIAEEFCHCNLVPHTKSSCKKKVYMYLRWMVRQNSSVDLGLWNWYPQSALLIPMDTHVIQEAVRLGLIPENAPANIKTARQLSARMNECFPDDPARADYALFGIGVDTD